MCTPFGEQSSTGISSSQHSFSAARRHCRRNRPLVPPYAWAERGDRPADEHREVERYVERDERRAAAEPGYPVGAADPAGGVVREEAPAADRVVAVVELRADREGVRPDGHPEADPSVAPAAAPAPGGAAEDPAVAGRGVGHDADWGVGHDAGRGAGHSADEGGRRVRRCGGNSRTNLQCCGPNGPALYPSASGRGEQQPRPIGVVAYSLAVRRPGGRSLADDRRGRFGAGIDPRMYD